MSEMFATFAQWVCLGCSLGFGQVAGEGPIEALNPRLLPIEAVVQPGVSAPLAQGSAGVEAFKPRQLPAASD